MVVLDIHDLYEMTAILRYFSVLIKKLGQVSHNSACSFDCSIVMLTNVLTYDWLSLFYVARFNISTVIPAISAASSILIPLANNLLAMALAFMGLDAVFVAGLAG